MKKNDAIKALADIKEIAYNRERNANKRLDDIIRILRHLPTDALTLNLPPLRVRIDGVIYDSVNAAAGALRIYPITVRNRIVSKNEKFKSWEYVYTPRSRSTR